MPLSLGLTSSRHAGSSAHDRLVAKEQQDDVDAAEDPKADRKAKKRKLHDAAEGAFLHASILVILARVYVSLLLLCKHMMTFHQQHCMPENGDV